MPIYEYRCKACGDLFEVIQRFSDRPLRKCRVCNGRVEKLISRTSFQLKGGGWYAQGYGPGKSLSDKTSSGTASTDSSKPKESKPKESKAKSSDEGKSGD